MLPKKSHRSEIALASDHAGFAYKAELLPELREKGYLVLDLGVSSDKPADYPDIARKMANAVLKGRVQRGILICGSGVGVSVAANKFPGICAGVCHDCYSARQGVEHDNINILCLGSRVIGVELARNIIQTFLDARFAGEKRHQRRLKKLKRIEQSQLKRE